MGARRATRRAEADGQQAADDRNLSDGWLSGLFNRPGANEATRGRVVKEGMGWAEIPFGDDLKADLFYPADKPAGKCRS